MPAKTPTTAPAMTPELDDALDAVGVVGTTELDEALVDAGVAFDDMVWVAVVLTMALELLAAQ